MSETKIKDLRINKGLTKQQLIESATITENDLSFVTDNSVVDVPAPTEAGKVLTSTTDGVKWTEGGSGGGSEIEWATSWDMPEDWVNWAYPTYKLAHLPDGTYKVYYRSKYFSYAVGSGLPATQCAIFEKKDGSILGGTISPVMDGDTFASPNYHFVLINSGYSFNISVGAETGALYFYSYDWQAWASDIGAYATQHGAIKDCLMFSVIENVETGEKYTPELVGVSIDGGPTLIPEQDAGGTSIACEGRYISSVNIGQRSIPWLGSSTNALFVSGAPEAFWTPVCDETALMGDFWSGDLAEVNVSLSVLSQDKQSIAGTFRAKVVYGTRVLEQTLFERSGIFADAKFFLYTWEDPETTPRPNYSLMIGTESGEPFVTETTEVFVDVTRISSNRSYNNLSLSPTTAGKEATRDFIRVVTPGSGGGAVDSVNGKTGAVVLNAEDVSAEVDGKTDTIQGHLQTNADAIDSVKDQIGDINTALDSINGEVA